MPLFLFVILPILEIYVFIQVGSQFGYMNATFGILISTVIGVGIAKSRGKYIFRNLQQSMAQRQLPEGRLVHSLLIFIGGLLLAVPGFLTSIAGLFFILPGTRHVLSLWLKARLLTQIGLGKFGLFSSSGVAGFGFGNGGFRAGFRSAGPAASGFDFQNRPSSPDDAIHSGLHERDVTPRVIDVTPITSVTEAVDAQAPRSKAGENGSDQSGSGQREE